MESRTAYTSKADNYAKYRWDYSPEAINKMVETTGVSEKSSIADIGAGTGVLSKHFVEIVKNVFAVEINLEMRSLAECSLKQYQTVAYDFVNKLTWDAFFGAMLSASYAPTEDHPKYPKFEQAVRYVFDRFNTNGYIRMHGTTELHLGQIFCPSITHQGKNEQ